MNSVFRHFPALARGLLLWLASCAALVPAHGIAQAYRWIDANGKTHFSDQPPLENTTSYETIDAAGNAGSWSQQTGPEGTYVEADFTGTSLVVTHIELPWQSQAANPTTVGRYYFGKACASATAMVLPAALQQHRDLFPRAEFIGSEIAHQLRQHNLSAYWDDRIAESNASQWPNALRLRARLSNLNFDTCAPTERRTFMHVEPADLAVKKFQRHRIQFSVAWQLLSIHGREIFQSNTDAYIDSWNQSQRVDDAFRQALQVASTRLLNQPEFKATIQQHQPTTAANAAPQDTESALEGAGLWQSVVEKTSNYLGFFRQSKLSKALALLPPIKIGIAEFYMHEGYWPGDLRQIHMDEGNLVNNTEGLQRLYLEANGGILLKLDEKFGHDARLLIAPLSDPGNNVIYWRCTTNITAKYVPRGLNCVHSTSGS